MPLPPSPITTKVHHGVAVYLFLSVGLILGVIAAITYLFTGK